MPEEPQLEKPLSTMEWVVTVLVLMVPIVNIVMYFVWAFTEGNISRRNFCRAQLLIFACLISLMILVFVIVLAFGGMAAVFSSHRSTF